MKRIIIPIFCLIIVLMSCISCASPNTIEVTSMDYPNLTKMSPGEFDENLYWLDVVSRYQFGDYSCFVSVENGKLCVSNKKSDVPDTQSQMLNDGCLVGVDYGEFSGWVRWFFCEDLIYPEGKKPEPTEALLSDKNCRYIIRHGNREAFVVLVDYSFVADEPSKTTVYMFKEAREKTGNDFSLEFTELAEFDGDCTAYLYCEEKECIYFAHDRGITVMNFDGTAEDIVRDDIFRYMRDITSIVRFEDELWCGYAYGIYRYNPETEESFWYPMDYEKYVN